jgi:lysophospholipase L1-like esterase
VATFILFFYSALNAKYHLDILGLRKVSILSDVFSERRDSVEIKSGPAGENMPSIAVSEPEFKAESLVPGDKALRRYKLSKTIISFNTDTSKPSLPFLMQKLIALKQGQKRKIRIGWFGDSMIEGDLLSQTFRKRIQQFFGNNYGVGFIPANSVTASFRNTASHKWKGDWKEENFKTKELSVPLYLSGHTYFTSNGELNIKDLSFKDTLQQLQKSIICGPVAGGNILLTINGQPKQFKVEKQVNRLLLDSSTSHNIEVEVKDSRLPVYGISLEPESGVVVDNFSFRGITGLELAKLDSSFLQTLETENEYDLVILEYGANLMFRPDDMDYSWYKKHIIPVVKKLQRAMPHTEFLIISTADRAFLYGDSWKTAVGIENLIKIQAEMACADDAAFYNMYLSMGGEGTIVKWADSTPSLANKDYIHPNFRGAEILGNMLYDAFIKDFYKAGRLNAKGVTN